MRNEEIKEALAQVERIERHVRWACVPLGAIRTALESAQREAEAWEAIEAWGKSQPAIPLLGYHAHETASQRWQIRVPQLGAPALVIGYGATRLEALEAAAKWCRAEMAK